MRKLLVTLFWVLFGAGCKTQIVEKIILPCDCKDAALTTFYQPTTVLVLFPKTPTEPYSIQDRSTTIEIFPIMTVCSDSTFIGLVKGLKVADSSMVRLTKWGYSKRQEITCTSEYNKATLPVRILAMKKL